MRNMLAVAMVAGLAALAQARGDVSVPDEKPYDFRKRLECVHERDRRDPAAKPGADEFAITDGAAVAVPADADEVLALAGKDFCDYLDVSMGVSARFVRGGDGASHRSPCSTSATGI